MHAVFSSFFAVACDSQFSYPPTIVSFLVKVLGQASDFLHVLLLAHIPTAESLCVCVSVSLIPTAEGVCVCVSVSLIPTAEGDVFVSVFH